MLEKVFEYIESKTSIKFGDSLDAGKRQVGKEQTLLEAQFEGGGQHFTYSTHYDNFDGTKEIAVGYEHALLLVGGRDSNNNQFTDLVLTTWYGTAVVVDSATRGSPNSRTYDQTDNLTLSYNGPIDIHVLNMEIS